MVHRQGWLLHKTCSQTDVYVPCFLFVLMLNEMKTNLFIVYSFVYFLMYACSPVKQTYEVCFVADNTTDSVTWESFLPESGTLNVFYNICVDDSFLYCLDFHNDSILKVYSLASTPSVVGYAMQGQGPDDLIFPLFTCEIVQVGESIRMVDVNAWRMKEIKTVPTVLGRVSLRGTALPIVPMMEDYAETASCIYGTDIDTKNGAFFMYDKVERKVTSIGFNEEVDELVQGYSEESVPFLLSGHLLLHPEAGLCRTMKNSNSLFFYNLQGELLKEIVIGKERKWPKDDGKKCLDFSDEEKYTLSVTGTEKVLCVLYHGYSLQASGQCSKILMFDWDGNLVRIVQTDRDVSRIAISPDGKYLYGLAETEEGGTDVVRLNI